MKLEETIKKDRRLLDASGILNRLESKSHEKQAEVLKKLSLKEKIILYTWAGVYEGSQRPKSQKKFEKKYGLPKDSAFKANIALSVGEAAVIGGLSCLSGELSHYISNSWLNGFLSAGEKVAFWDAVAISANFAGRSLWYLSKKEPAFTCWGWRSYVVGADYAKEWIINKIGKKSKEQSDVGSPKPL